MKNIFKAVLFMLVLVLSATFVSAVADPATNAIPDQAITEGSPLRIALASTTTAGGLANFSVCRTASQPGACTGEYNNKSIVVGSTTLNISTLSATTGEINWTPDFTQAGTYFFNVTANVSDLSSSKTFKVTVNDATAKLSATSVLPLGSTSQARSNPNHDTISSRGQNVTGSIILTNSGSAPETISSLEAKATFEGGFTASDLLINYTFPKTTLAQGESLTLPIRVRVPEKLDAVKQTLLSESAVNVATLTFSAVSSAGTPVTASTAITLQAENQLEITNDVKITYGDKSKSAGHDDTVKDLRAGQEIEIEINVKNTFTEKEDVEVQDVLVRAVSGLLDIDEEEDVGDLGPQDKEKVRFIVTLDEDASDGTYDLEITAEGKDEFGARHGERMIVKLDITRKQHDIEIKGILVNPPTVSCGDNVKVTANIRNSGRSNDNAVVVRVASPELNFGAMTNPIELDENDEDSVSFNVPVPATVPRPANYRINVETYYSTTTLSNSDVALLKVEKCGLGKEEEQPPVVTPPKEESPVVVVPPQQPPVNVTPPQPPAEKKSFLQAPQYMALLVLAYIVVLGGGAALLVKLFRK